jgi:trimeric autotransporter adhesin
LEFRGSARYYMNAASKRLKCTVSATEAGIVLIACIAISAGGRGQAAQLQQGTVPPLPPTTASVQSATTAPEQTRGILHGTVHSGETPLPGVRITATNTLTGKQHTAATDAAGRYSMTIRQNGPYVVRAEFTVFAAATKAAVIDDSLTNQHVDFSLVLASSVGRQEAEQDAQNIATRQYSGAGTQTLNLVGSAMNLIAPNAGEENAGAQLPSIAGTGDFSSESVAVSGQGGAINQFAGVDVNQLREQMQRGGAESFLMGTPEAPGGQSGGIGALSGGTGGMGTGANDGRTAPIFRNLKPNQPHGAFFWTGGNGALNATDFPIRGQQIVEPSYGQNQLGFRYVGAPYIPRLLQNDTKDFLFLGLNTQRSSQPFDEYGTVPTAEERVGNLASLTAQNGSPITLYNPSASPTVCTASGNTPGQPFIGNIIPPVCISKQAQALLNYVPLPNLPGEFLNYQRLTAAQTNTTKLGFRFNRSIGSGVGSPLVGMLQRYLGANAPGQSFYVNYNFMHNGADQLSLFPDFDGKSQINQNSLQLGYSLGIGKLTNNFSVNWNRTNTQISNEFTNTTNIAAAIGLNGLPSNPLLYGLPSVTMNQFSSLNEQQPNFRINQTIAASESSVWTHGKHNVKFGADVRRVHLDMIGETNSTGSYIFTGVFTTEPGTSTSGVGASGSSLADLLLGLPQQTAIQAPYQKAYLRQNAYDAYAQDDWRTLPSLTLLYGLRYEYFSPYSEKDDRLATLDTGNDFASVATVLPNGIGPFTGKYPRGLVYPEHDNFSPRVGFAWSVARDTVLRGGYGINFTNGQYVTFAQNLAFEPPWADVQTNEFSAGAPITLANGFLGPNAEGNYAINKDYRLPYIQAWTLNLQRTVPWNVVLNIGYAGSKGTRLDIVDAPGRTATESLSGVLYDYEDSVGFSNYNALTASARKRLTGGLSLQARYTYSHSIDNASSIGGQGGTAVVPAQNWQDLRAEESNSSFDSRHQVVGTFLYELPFGTDTHWLTAGRAGQALSNISVSGAFDLATGEPLTPHYTATVADVARGSAGSLRPDRVPGVSLMQDGGSLDDWFNKDAFTAPGHVYGTASRFSIPGPGTVSFTTSLSKTIRFSETRSFELRAIANNVFNTVQYSTVDSTLGSASFGQVTGSAPMRQFIFLALYRF